MKKKKLAIFDMDGTLFDTRIANFGSYERAMEALGYSSDYDYFAAHCNGMHYRSFLPQIMKAKNPDLTEEELDTQMEEIHELKKACYPEFLDDVRENEHLFCMMRAMRDTYNLALVTTANKKNCYELLDHFHRREEFDLILMQEDVKKKKPHPEGFLMAMEHFGVRPEDTIVFEDSDVGEEAARAAGADAYMVKGYA